MLKKLLEKYKTRKSSVQALDMARYLISTNRDFANWSEYELAEAILDEKHTTYLDKSKAGA